MSMEYIRRTYGVPAKRGGLIIYTDGDGRRWRCRITGAVSGGHLAAVTETRTKRFLLHPTWNVEYLPTTARQGGGMG